MKVAVPEPAVKEQTTLLTGVPVMVQDVSVAVNPVRATEISVPGGALLGVGVADGAA